MTIKWHEESLANWTRSHEERLGIHQAAAIRLKIDAEQLAIYRDQIERAKREGKDGFDSERYGKTKKL
jgi:hypothetical protein